MKKIHCGIYLITNQLTNKLYVGSSRNIKKRWNNHKQQLKKKKHSNIFLQNAVDKYGLNNFNFSIIEECEIVDLITKEVDWVTFFDSRNPKNGYNIMVPGTSPYDIVNNSGKNLRQEAIKNNQQIELIDIGTLKIVDKLPLLVDVCTKYNLNQKKVSEVLNNRRTSYKGYIVQREDKPKDLIKLQEIYRRFNNKKEIRDLIIQKGRTWSKEKKKAYSKEYWQKNKHKYNKKLV